MCARVVAKNLKFGDLTSLFCRVSQEHVIKCAPHVQHNYFSSFTTIVLLFRGVLADDRVVDRKVPIRELKQGRRRWERERQKTIGLMRKTMGLHAPHVRFAFLYIPLPFSPTRRRGMIKFTIQWRTWVEVEKLSIYSINFNGVHASLIPEKLVLVSQAEGVGQWQFRCRH